MKRGAAHLPESTVKPSAGAGAQAYDSWPGAGLFERERECQLLTEAFRRMHEHGELVLIDGPAGIGKTRMLGWAGEAARGYGARVLTARGDELERQYPFGVLRQLLSGVLRADEAAGDAPPDWAAPAARALTAEFGEAQDKPADPSEGTLYALYWLLARITDRGPLLIVVDDVHWADAASLRFLHYLTGRMAELPLMVLLAARVHDPDGTAGTLVSISSRPETRRVRLAPLSANGTSALVRDRVGSAADEEFCAACHGVTAGNPFFVVSLVDEFARRRLPPRAGAASVIRTLSPDSVAGSLLLTLSRLGPSADALARAVAVLGDGAELRVAERLARLDHADAQRAADALSAADLLQGRDRLEFVHPIVRSSIHSGLQPQAWSEAHLDAARLLASDHAPPERIVAHLLATAPVGEHWVVVALRDAATDALGRGAPDSAATYLRRALGEPLHPEERARLLLALAAAEPRGSSETVEHAREALALADRPGRAAATMRAEAARLLFANLLMSDRPQEALQVIDAVIGDLDPDDDRELRLSLEADLAALTLFHPDYSTLLGERLDRLQPELSAATNAERRVLAMLAYRKVQVLASADEAASLAERALAGGHLLAERIEANVPMFAAGIALGLAGRIEAAEALFSEMIARFRMSGSMSGLASACGDRGAERFHRGALDDALADVEATLEFAKGRPWIPPVHHALGHFLWIQIERGEIDTADRVLSQWGLTGSLPDSYASSTLLVGRGGLRLAQCHFSEALADLEEAGQREARWGRSVIFEWRRPAALAHHGLGNLERARELAAEDFVIAKRWGAPRQIGLALDTLGMIERGERSIELLREAVRVLADSPARLDHARAVVDLGAMLRRAGRTSEARATLRAGREKALQCGARALAGRADDELAATGERRRRAVLSGPQALTPTERRIVRLAAQGLSNLMIAQTLFITRKTVEMHLSNAYRTLGIRSREQLIAALAATEVESANGAASS